MFIISTINLSLILSWRLNYFLAQTRSNSVMTKKLLVMVIQNTQLNQEHPAWQNQRSQLDRYRSTRGKQAVLHKKLNIARPKKNCCEGYFGPHECDSSTTCSIHRPKSTWYTFEIIWVNTSNTSPQPLPQFKIQRNHTWDSWHKHHAMNILLFRRWREQNTNGPLLTLYAKFRTPVCLPRGISHKGHAAHDSSWSVVLGDGVRLDLDDLSPSNLVTRTLPDGVLSTRLT